MRRFTFCIFIFLLAFQSFARNAREYELLISQASQKNTLQLLTDDLVCKGRASGTPGCQAAGRFITSRFKAAGLKPYNWSYTQSVSYQDSIVLRNIVGYLPSTNHSDEYIVVGAHYDHLGFLAGKIYCGADDNASGVTALLSLVDMFCAMKASGDGPEKNIIFVAYDGKELSMSGSEAFVKRLEIPKEKIVAAVNLDMIGTDLVPPHLNNEYLIVLGENTLDEKYHGFLKYICGRPEYSMDLDLTFYSSKAFTQMYYQMGDHYSFAKAGIPSLLFTSAFHKHTYRPTDTPQIINFPLLRKRTMVIFQFINHLCLN